MYTISINFPKASDKVPAGQNGVITADLNDAFSILHCVNFSVLDSMNQLIWKGTGSISGSTVIASLSWPSTPGTYTLKAECVGDVLGNLISEDSTKFEVVTL